jgi:hypothetical protein
MELGRLGVLAKTSFWMPALSSSDLMCSMHRASLPGGLVVSKRTSCWVNATGSRQPELPEGGVEVDTVNPANGALGGPLLFVVRVVVKVQV